MEPTVLAEFQAAGVRHPGCVVHLKPVGVVWDSTTSELEEKPNNTVRMICLWCLLVPRQWKNLPCFLLDTNWTLFSALNYTWLHQQGLDILKKCSISSALPTETNAANVETRSKGHICSGRMLQELKQDNASHVPRLRVTAQDYDDHFYLADRKKIFRTQIQHSGGKGNVILLLKSWFKLIRQTSLCADDLWKPLWLSKSFVSNSSLWCSSLMSLFGITK